jgi:TonB family protein
VVTEDGVAQTIVIFEFQRLDATTQGPGSYYSLGYYTTNQNMDGNYRRIQIACQGDPAARLDYRAGYYTVEPKFAGLRGNGQSTADQSIDPAITFPVLLYKMLPEYSEEARKAKYQGTVLLKVLVDASGQVANVDVARSLGLGLDEKAMAAVRQWKFRPGTKDGKPVIMQAQVEMNFRLL